jgi:hypothetical protein
VLARGHAEPDVGRRASLGAKRAAAGGTLGFLSRYGPLKQTCPTKYRCNAFYRAWTLTNLHCGSRMRDTVELRPNVDGCG